MVERAGELLRALRDHGPCTRTQLAETLGLSRSTVVGELAQLVEGGLVQDGSAPVSSGGRPSAQVQLDDRLRVVAVSIGETRARVAVLDAGLTILGGSSLPLSGLSDSETVDWVVQSTRELLHREADEPRAAVPPTLGLALAEGALGAAERDRLAVELGLVPVVSLAPVRAMARGEGHVGACRSDADYLVVRLGTSITCTTVSGGRQVDGYASAGGEIGHFRVEEFGPACTCGNSGCLDSFVGIPALLEQARSAGEAGRSVAFSGVLAQREGIDVADLVAAVAEGDRVAVQIARDAGRRVGEVVAALVAFANPRRVVLGGPVAALGDNLLAEVRAGVYRKAPAALTHGLSIELSDLGERAVLFGAAYAATECLFDAPIKG